MSSLLIEHNPEKWLPAERHLMYRAGLCAAPVAVAKNKAVSRRVHQTSGSRYADQKRFIDLRNGTKISLGQAKQIVASFESSNS